MGDNLICAHYVQSYPMGYGAVNDGTRGRGASLSPMKNDKTEMGARIKMLRNARGLSQPALARELVRLGGPATVSRATVAKWENGDTTNIQNKTFILLCDALQTDPAYLLWGEDRGPPPKTPPDAPTGDTGRFRIGRLRGG